MLWNQDNKNRPKYVFSLLRGPIPHCQLLLEVVLTISIFSIWTVSPNEAWIPSLVTFRNHHRSTSSSHFQKQASFDFSSTYDWDKFYEESNSTTDGDVDVDVDGGSGSNVMEWHSSVALEDIASYVPSNSDCLIIGCGNSRLPQTILSTRNDTRIVLLDTSQTCLEQLQKVYGTSVEYQCGDATKLSDIFWNGSSDDNHNTSSIDDNTRQFDIIIDKGLTDAILCGEGWNGPLTKLFEESAKVFKQDKDGVYLLISYKLPSSTKEFITEIGKDLNIDWDFDIPYHSNQRVSVSLGRRRPV